MKRFVALLRGINVSGKNKIPMAELKKDFENLALPGRYDEGKAVRPTTAVVGKVHILNLQP